MKDPADETNEDLALAIVADEKPVIFNPGEDAAGMQGCEYCGHNPCGCGG